MMVRFISMSFVAVVAVGAVAAFGQGNKGLEGSKPKDVVNVVAIELLPEEETEPIAVEQGDVVRLTPSAPAGTTATVEVEGPAKLLRKAVVQRIVDGRPLIGASGAEFEFSTTGKGNVEVTFTLQGGPFGDEPKKEVVRFMVK